MNNHELASLQSDLSRQRRILEAQKGMLAAAERVQADLHAFMERHTDYFGSGQSGVHLKTARLWVDDDVRVTMASLERTALGIAALAQRLQEEELRA